MRSEDHYPHMPSSINTNDFNNRYDIGYNNGLNAAWDIVRKIIHLVEIPECLMEIYGENNLPNIIFDFDADKAIERYVNWEKAQDIKIGDILEHRNDPNIKMVVIVVNDNNVSGFSEKGIFSKREKTSWKPTGMNVREELNTVFNEIQELTKKRRFGGD